MYEPSSRLRNLIPLTFVFALALTGPFAGATVAIADSRAAGPSCTPVDFDYHSPGLGTVPDVAGTSDAGGSPMQVTMTTTEKRQLFDNDNGTGFNFGTLSEMAIQVQLAAPGANDTFELTSACFEWASQCTPAAYSGSYTAVGGGTSNAGMLYTAPGAPRHIFCFGIPGTIQVAGDAVLESVIDMSACATDTSIVEITITGELCTPPTTTTTSTTVTTTTSTTLPGGGCPSAPVDPCIAAAQAKFDVNERRAGREKLKAQWKRLDATTVQADFGDPVAGTTSAAVCIFDDAGALVAELDVDRPGADCSGKPCWRAKGSRAYGYSDSAASSAGVSRLGFTSGDAGRGLADVQAKNQDTRGLVSMPVGIAAALAGNSAPTMQMITSEGFCVGATLEVSKDDGTRYAARVR